MAKGSSQSSTLFTSSPQDAQAKSLIHALSEITHWSLLEYHESLPANLVTLEIIRSYVMVACKSAAASTLMTFLLAPFSLAVIAKIFPAFGNTSPMLIDKIYIYLFSATPAVAFAILITTIITQAYTGEVTKRLVGYFTSTYIVIKILLSLFLLFVYFQLSVYMFNPRSVWSFLTYFEVFLLRSPGTKEMFFQGLVEFGTILVPAAIFATIVHIGTAALITFGRIRGAMKTRTLEMLRKEWE